MNKYDKVRDFCKNFRVVLGIVLITIGVFSGNSWFYLGAIPLLAGLFNFCPTCIISKKCTPKS
ncbi:MAG: hypothetical protein B1H07_03090 [Campylobacteraceae bacterium 4484_166]|nr:MAG: hypothetical protein B1H07_03090 [Campylobacteraceae bacterium 4484_166]